MIDPYAIAALGQGELAIVPDVLMSNLIGLFITEKDANEVCIPHSFDNDCLPVPHSGPGRRSHRSTTYQDCDHWSQDVQLLNA